jgi:hypothetical protein
MARQTTKPWAEIVAEAEAAGVPHAEIALKHRVSVPALKYHLYKSRRDGGAEARPRLLPVRLGNEPAMLQAQYGAIRLTFPEGCSPAYVAALLTALSKTAC